MSSTVSHLLMSGREVLSQAGVPEPQLDARILLQHATGMTLESIVAHGEKLIDQSQAEIYEGWIARRASREPVSHLIGVREFWGLEFQVTPDTLDPRPDSETLIEAVLEAYPDKTTPLKIADFGTGTGCLLLSLLYEYEQATGVAIDLSEGALTIAKRNASKLGLANRTSFHLQYWGEGLNDCFDIIVSNPPYITEGDIDTLSPEVSMFEPRSALVAGPDGLSCYRDIAPYLSSCLKEEGIGVIEIGFGQDNEVTSILEAQGLVISHRRSDLAGVCRCLVVKHPNR